MAMMRCCGSSSGFCRAKTDHTRAKSTSSSLSTRGMGPGNAASRSAGRCRTTGVMSTWGCAGSITTTGRLRGAPSGNSSARVWLVPCVGAGAASVAEGSCEVGMVGIGSAGGVSGLWARVDDVHPAMPTDNTSAATAACRRTWRHEAPVRSHVCLPVWSRLKMDQASRLAVCLVPGAGRRITLATPISRSTLVAPCPAF